MTSSGAWNVRQGVFIKVTGPDGRVGYGEAAPVPLRGKEDADVDLAACQALNGVLRGVSQIPADLPALRSAVRAATEPAAAPKQASLGVAALLPSGRAALKEAPRLAEAGFRVFKWKVGIAAAADELAMLDDLLGYLPGTSRVRLDANQAWSRRTAETWLAAAATRPIEFIEEPVADSEGREDTLLGLAADYPVPIALDESIGSEAGLARWLDLGWRGFFVVKPQVALGIDGALERLHAAQARVVFSSVLETAIGAQSALRTAFSWPGRVPALGFGVWPLFADSRFDGPPAVPLLRPEDVSRISPEAVWNAAS